jgi:hypothetical protein
MEGQIENFLKNKDDHNFVWNRSFLWAAIEHLSSERNQYKEELHKLRRDMVDFLLQEDSSRSFWRALLVGLLVGLVAGTILGYWIPEWFDL